MTGQSKTISSKQATHNPQRYPIIKRHGLNMALVCFGEVLDEKTNQAARRFYAALLRENHPDIVECAPTLVSVFVEFSETAEFAGIKAFLREVLAEANDDAASAPKRLWHIPVCFDDELAPQLGDIAARLGKSELAVIEELCAAELCVLAIGFAPGQPYIGLLPEAWNFPRRSSLNPNIARGAIAASLRQIVLFQNQSATGWYHIGQTKFDCFVPERADPFALRAGDRVRFAPVSKLEFDALAALGSDGFGGAKLTERT